MFMSLKKTFSLALLTAGISGWSAPFPAEVMKWTTAEKNQQRQAGTELLKKIYAATAAKQTAFSIPQGIYRFRETQQPWQPTHILLNKVNKFTLEGNGSWFYFENQASALKLSNCDNVTIKNLNIDYDPLPYVQGTVVSISDNTTPRTFVFKPDPGYTMPEKLLDDKKNTTERRIFLWDKATGLLKKNQMGMDIVHEPQAIKKLADGNYEVKTWIWWGRSLKEAGFEPGIPVTMLRRAGRAIRMEVCGRIELDNVDVYASGFVAYVGHQGDGPFIIRNCDLKRRPGTDRLLSGNADGFNIRGILKGAIIENCSAEAIGDDCVNLQGVYYKVFKQVSPTELIVATTTSNDGAHPVWHFISGDPWNDPARPGNKKLKTWAFLGKRQVLEKTALNYTIPSDRKMHAWAAASRYQPGKSYPALKVKLDAPIKVDENSIFWSENSIVKGSVIRNNVFHNNVARGIRLQTIDAVVENNKISYTTGCALSLAGQPGFWGESTNCQNVVIRNNVFKDSGRCGGNAAITMTVEGDQEKAEPIANILFERNQIINPRGSGIELSGCDNIRLIDNIITGLASLPYQPEHNPDSARVKSEDYGKPVVVGKGVKNLTVVKTPAP